MYEGGGERERVKGRGEKSIQEEREGKESTIISKASEPDLSDQENSYKKYVRKNIIPITE